MFYTLKKIWWGILRVLSRIRNLGGEAIVDNVAIGGGCERGMCSLLREVRKLKHYMT